MPRAHGIFVTNNGLADHIGIAQVLPYLAGLAQAGHRIELISVESREGWQRNGARVSEMAAARGIAHHPIHRRSSLAAKLERYAMPRMIERRLKALMAKRTPDLIHCRSYMPLAASLRCARRSGAALLFDARGFWIDQRIEGGAWNPQSPVGKFQIATFRKLESAAYREAAQIVVLTQDAKAVVEQSPAHRGAPVSVIPCSVDQQSFAFDAEARETIRSRIGYGEDDKVFAYLGSASGLYRMELIYRLYDAARAAGHKARLMFIGNHSAAAHQRAAAALGITIAEEHLHCEAVDHSAVPAMLSAADVGMSFIVSTPSSLGVSATKVGEYLACGLPVLSNAGIGDIARIITNGRNGFVLPDDSDAAIADGLAAITSGTFAGRAEIKAGSQDYFSLAQAIARYDAIYSELAA